MASSITVDELASLGESQTVEFKKSLSLTKEGLMALNAMANAEAGRGLVLFGVAPDGVPCGIEPGNHDTAQQSLAREIRAKFDPPLLVDIHLVECAGHVLMAVSAQQRSPGVRIPAKSITRSGRSRSVIPPRSR